MVDWAAARAMLEESCAGVFDKTECVLQPRKGGLGPNHKETDDDGREPFPFLGTIDLEATAGSGGPSRPTDPGASGAVTYGAVLSAHVGGWPYLPRRGDFVIADGVTWKIMAKEKDGSSRPAWYLNEV